MHARLVVEMCRKYTHNITRTVEIDDRYTVVVDEESVLLSCSEVLLEHRRRTDLSPSQTNEAGPSGTNEETEQNSRSPVNRHIYRNTPVSIFGHFILVSERKNFYNSSTKRHSTFADSLPSLRLSRRIYASDIHAHRQSWTKRAHAHSRVTPSYIAHSVYNIIVTHPSALKVHVKRCFGAPCRRRTLSIFFKFNITILYLLTCSYTSEKPSKSFFYFRFPPASTAAAYAKVPNASYGKRTAVTAAAVAATAAAVAATCKLHSLTATTSLASHANCSDESQKNVLRVRHMVGQRRPSRSCSILIWGGFLLLYAALTAIIDCTQSNGTSTTVIPLSSSVKQSSSADLVTTDDTYASGDGQTILPTQSLLQNENQTTERISVLNTANTSTIVTDEATEKCTPPAIKQFPRPFMRPSVRRRGGILIHIIICIYSFLGLAIVCDHYFVKSLDRICEELKVSPDVAGATFMAAGSSAPELATVVIGVFLAKDDIGVSGVIGSAVFNIMFVIAVCGLASTTVTYLNWWPLCRDSFFYTISILIMLLAIYNETISWIESSMLLLAYVVYCVALYYNLYLEAWANTWNLPFPPRNHGQINELFADQQTSDMKEGQEQIQLTGTKSPTGYDTTGSTGIDQEQNQQQKNQQIQQNPDYYIPKVYHEADEVNPLLKPENGNILHVIQWAVMYPIYFTCYYTMPDCRKENFKNWYGLTFVISMLWISVYSYIMVWMITVIGNTLGIPDTVMGLTFVAAGVSVPDALSSLSVVKEGYGDMAVSNAIGSNVFDILVCLGLPWFLQTAVFNPGSTVKVYSKGLTYCTLTLLSTVVFLLVATHMNGWKLDRKFGAVLMLWYLIFIAIASLYEMNGTMNPPSCLTDY